MQKKQRLDTALSEKYPEYSKTQIQSFIMQGYARINGTPALKAGTAVKEQDILELFVDIPKYVCRAGLKLEHALEYFTIDVRGMIALDAGLSTGGFTDCLLQKGVQKVYGIDVGHGQTHEKIARNPRVVIHEKTNLRYLTTVGELVDIITLDLSFISLLKVMDAVCALLKPDGLLITLIKPQFEAERHEVEAGGLITDQRIHERIITTVTKRISEFGFTCVGVTPSPISGTTGNREFCAFFRRIPPRF
jgi:23S rRNA (cytidine1920-2'-O)/16S rRNA (cytidine1409-2'-O)-methyltransferase